MVRILVSKYAESEFRVRGVNGVLTKPIKSLSGVMQGDQISSLLFILFLNDLEEHLKELAERYAPSLDGVVEIGSLWFADDVCLLSTSEIGAVRMLESFNEYCEHWNLTINTDKTKVVEFRKRGSRRLGKQIMLGGRKIEYVKEFKYLGVVFEEKGGWSAHMSQRRISAVRTSLAIGKMMWKLGSAPISLGMHVFDVVSKAIMLYGVEFSAFSGNWVGMERAARAFYKKVLGLPRGTAGVGVEALLGRIRMKDEGVIRALMFWRRLISLPGDHLARKSWDVQRAWADGGVSCWGMEIKSELAKLGQPGWWENQNTL